MFPYTFPDRLLELRGLEQSRTVGNTSDGLVGLKYLASHTHVYFFASLEIQAEATEHQSDQAASAGTDDQVEVIAGFGNLVATRRLTFAFDIGAVHEFLEENKHGVTTNTTAICSGQLSLIYAGKRDNTNLETGSAAEDPWWCPCGADWLDPWRLQQLCFGTITIALFFFSAAAAYPRRGSAMPYAPGRGMVGA